MRTLLLVLALAGCSQGYTKAGATAQPNTPTFTQVHKSVYNAPSVTVTCPPSNPQVTGGGGSGYQGLALSEPTSTNDGWTTSATPSSLFPTTVYAVCEGFGG